MADQVVITQDGRKYGALVTDIGRVKMADAVLNGDKVNIVHLAVGDGGGGYYLPEAGQTALRGEQWRGEIAYKEIDGDSPNVLNIRGVVPTDVGGFTIREAGLFDDEGALIVVANLPDTEKAVILEGISASLDILLHVAFTDMDAVEITVNPDLDTISHEEAAQMLDRHDRDMTAHGSLLSQYVLRSEAEGMGGIRLELPFTIVAEDWQEDGTGDYPFYCDIAGDAVSEDWIPDVCYDENSLPAAGDCGACATAESFTGYVRVKCAERPKAALSGVCRLWALASIGGGGGGVSVHSDLQGRDAPGQHPISSITGLEQALADKPNTADLAGAMAGQMNELSAKDVEEIWNKA